MKPQGSKEKYSIVESLAMIATHEPLEVGKVVKVHEAAGEGGYVVRDHKITMKDVQRVADHALQSRLPYIQGGKKKWCERPQTRGAKIGD